MVNEKLLHRASLAVLVLSVLALGGIIWNRNWVRSTPRNLSSPLHSGTQQYLVLIGSSGCSASKLPGLRPAVRSIRRELLAKAKQTHTEFRTMGVALDYDIPQGLAFLSQFDAFDQVAIGGNWTNFSVVRFVWRDFPARAAVPQLILVEHDVTVGQKQIVVGPDRIVTRKIGLPEIEAWERNGASIPKA